MPGAQGRAPGIVASCSRAPLSRSFKPLEVIMPFRSSTPRALSLTALAAVASLGACGGPAPDDEALSSATAALDSPFHDATPPAATPVACRSKWWSPGDHVVTVTSGGLTRRSRLHVPVAYDPRRGTPLVLNFHGVHSNGIEQELLTGMSAASEARRFIVAYPEGTGGVLDQSWNAGSCCGVAGDTNVDDVGFVRALLASLEADYCIDPARVYATGFSNGGYFTNRLACEMAGTFAAVAQVGGLLSLDPLKCNPSRPVPYLDFHGTADPVVIFGGGTGLLGGTNAPVAETITAWRQKEACGAASQILFRNGDTTCTRWNACAPGGEVIQCIVTDGGHTWPGGLPTVVVGKTTYAVNATSAMLDFFDAHPMR
jgi:polyhydroxybutyrate depolymerase